MKKIKQIIMLCAMIIALASCETNVEDQTAVLVQEYKEACENQEYGKAYTAVEKLRIMSEEIATQEPERKYDNHNNRTNRKEISNWRTKYDNAKNNYIKAEKYVVLNEATYVLETQGMEGMTRLAYIIKEHKAKWVIKDLVDMAKAIGKEELVESLNQLNLIQVKNKYEEMYDDVMNY